MSEYYHFKFWSLMLANEITGRQLNKFEDNMKTMYGEKVFNKWAKWSEKLHGKPKYRPSKRSYLNSLP